MTRIQLRRDTSSNWQGVNPIPSAGEPCFELDTGKLKIGDGTSHYKDLPYQNGGDLPTNLVTTDTEQQITAQKEFTATIKVSDDIVTSEGLRIANGGLGAGKVSLGDGNANLTIYSNGAPQVVTNGDAQTLIDTGNIGNYAASTQDVAELGNELSQLTNDVTNLEGQINSLNTSIESKQNILTFKEPLKVKTQGYNPTFLTNNGDGTFKSNIITSGSRTLLNSSGTSSTSNYVTLPCTDSTYSTIDWSKLIYYKIDNLEGKIFKVSGNTNQITKMHFCKKDDTFLPRFSTERSSSNSTGVFATYNGDITPDSKETMNGYTVPVGYWKYTGTNLPRVISNAGTYGQWVSYLQLRFESASDTQYTVYYKDSADGAEKSFTIDKSVFADVDVVVFTQTQQNMNFADYGVFDSTTEERLWSPLQTYNYLNELSLDIGEGLVVSNGKLENEYYDNTQIDSFLDAKQDALQFSSPLKLSTLTNPAVKGYTVSDNTLVGNGLFYNSPNNRVSNGYCEFRINSQEAANDLIANDEYNTRVLIPIEMGQVVKLPQEGITSPFLMQFNFTIGSINENGKFRPRFAFRYDSGYFAYVTIPIDSQKSLRQYNSDYYVKFVTSSEKQGAGVVATQINPTNGKTFIQFIEDEGHIKFSINSLAANTLLTFTLNDSETMETLRACNSIMLTTSYLNKNYNMEDIGVYNIDGVVTADYINNISSQTNVFDLSKDTTTNAVSLNYGTGLTVQNSNLDINYDNLMVSLDHINRVNLSSTITASGGSYTPAVSGLLCAGVKSSAAGDYVGISSDAQYYRDFRYAQVADQWIAPQMPVNAGLAYKIEYSTANLTYCYFYPYKVSNKS